MATNYSTLSSAVQAYSENNDSEFTDEMQGFVDRTEAKLARDLDSFGVVFKATVTASVSSAFLTKPAGAFFIKSINMPINGSRVNLVMKTDEFVLDYWPIRSSVGVPKYWAQYDASTIILAPTPSSTHPAEIAYVGRPATLSAAGSTNFFTDFCPDALFYGCMVEAMLFMKNKDAAAVWESRYQAALLSLVNVARRERRDDLHEPDGESENTLVPGAD